MALNTEIKRWGDETAGISYIEGLNLPGDRKWEKVRIEVKGTKHKQSFQIKLEKAGKQTLLNESFKLSNGETWFKEISINDRCSLTATGKLSIWSIFPPAGGQITLTGYYEKYELESITKKWSDATAGKSFIERLELPPDHCWHHVTVACTGHKNKSTGVNISLIAGGELVNYPKHNSWFVLNGTQSVIKEYDLQQKASLMMAGYITNHTAIGGGADIEMTAYYKKGE